MWHRGGMTTALITGATAGIGREFAEQLAARGHDLVIVARDESRLAEVRDEITARYQVAVEVLAADLSDRTATERVAQRVSDRERPIDLLVNNAGYGLPGSFLETDIDDEEALLDVLVRAVLVLSHAAAQAMVSRGRGQIINVASVAAYLASGTYSAAKSWVVVFSESLSGQLDGTGVGVSVLAPGFVRTEFHERAAIDVGDREGTLWLDPTMTVQTALDDAGAGKVVSVPGLQYRAIVTLLRHLPRRVIRHPGVVGRQRPR